MFPMVGKGIKPNLVGQLVRVYQKGSEGALGAPTNLGLKLRLKNAFASSDPKHKSFMINSHTFHNSIVLQYKVHHHV